MKRLIILIAIACGCIMAMQAQSFASDWDKAGKALTITEGIRVITGGRVDLIGNITGINNPRGCDRGDGYFRYYSYEPVRHRSYEYRPHASYYRQVWVPHMVWREKYVPRHTEYRPGFGEVVIEAHYERYLVEEGGHWETVYEHR